MLYRLLNSLMPSVEKFLYIIFGGFSYKKVIGLTECFELFCPTPITGGESREIRSSQCRGFRILRAFKRAPQNIRLELHQKIISRGTSIYVQYAKFLPTIRAHCVCEVFNLVCKCFKCGSNNMCPRGSSGDSRNCSARVRLPPWRSQTGECGNNIDASGVRNTFCKV